MDIKLRELIAWITLALFVGYTIGQNVVLIDINYKWKRDVVQDYTKLETDVGVIKQKLHIK